MSKYIVAAWAESASGPGWGNSPLWYLVKDNADGKYSVECLQPEDQTREMRLLYLTSQAAHLAMTHEVRKAVKK
jgi:hypothetical protein